MGTQLLIARTTTQISICIIYFDTVESDEKYNLRYNQRKPSCSMFCGLFSIDALFCTFCMCLVLALESGRRSATGWRKAFLSDMR